MEVYANFPNEAIRRAVRHCKALGVEPMAISFKNDIRPLFRDSPDVDSMKEYGLDLSSYEEVKAQAAAIYARIEDGSMPCDGPWPEERLVLFKRWMEEGLAP
jgi:hypothetical protein